MTLEEAEKKLYEIDITDSASNFQENSNMMIGLLKEHPSLCDDAFKIIEENSPDIADDNKKILLVNICKIKPELIIDIINKYNNIYRKDNYTFLLQNNHKAANQIIKDYKSLNSSMRENLIDRVVCIYPDLFQEAMNVTLNLERLKKHFIKNVNQISEKNISVIMGEFSYKNFCEMYVNYKKELSEEGLYFIEKIVEGNLENQEILKKCLLLLQVSENNFYNQQVKNRIINKILTQQPKIKNFYVQLNILKMQIPTFPKLERVKGNKGSKFKYTTDPSELSQLQYRVNIKAETNTDFASYIKEKSEENEQIISENFKQRKEKQEQIISEINSIDKAISENGNLYEIIKRFNSLAKKIKNENFVAPIEELQNQRSKIVAKIKETHRFYGKQIQQLLKSPEKAIEILNNIDFSDDTSSIIMKDVEGLIYTFDNPEMLKVILHKKEEAYGKWKFEDIKRLEKDFEIQDYISKTLNEKYPGMKLSEQLIQAAYDVVNSGDEKKMQEFNEFILAEGEKRLYDLDKEVMDYLWSNCTQENLDKVNALRSFYGLKVELKTANTVDIDERTAVRKVFDRTWSSYERGTNKKTGEPYYSEADMKLNSNSAKINPYYESSVSPAYRKYFEENDIYEIYHNQKSDEEKKYSVKDYFDSMIEKSSFKALRKHGLYNDMKIICETLEALQVEPEIASQFNLKDLSDMVVNSHNTFEDRKVYNHETGSYMFTKSPHTDELNGYWRDPYYWHQDDYYDYGEDEDDKDNDENLSEDKKYDEEGFEPIPDDTDYYSDNDEEPAARDSWWEDLANHNPKAVKNISGAFMRHGREYAVPGFWEASSHGTPGVGSRKDYRLLSATLHHAEAIQYGGTDDKRNFVGVPRYYEDYGDTFAEDNLYLDPHKSFHHRDTPMDALYINPNANASNDKLAITKSTDENAQKAFLITSFVDEHMHFYGGFRKIDQYTDPLYKMRNIEKEKQERVNKTEEQLEFLTKLGNFCSSIYICISETLKTEEKIKTSKNKVAKKVSITSNKETSNVNRKGFAVEIKRNEEQYA